MAERREIEVKALARVEGEGRLYIRMRGDTVDEVQLAIYEPPRFFESFLRGREVREVPDITARICGICPVAYQMTACQALEKALQVRVTPEIQTLRRLLYCGEWIESHALHLHLLHAPDFLGYESGLTMAIDHPEVVKRGLRMKKIGNEILRILGGRAIHPVNVAVGGFYRLPSIDALRHLLTDLDWGLQAAKDTVKFVSQFEFPDFSRDYECISLVHPTEYPMNEGRIVSNEGLHIDVGDYERHFAERHIAHSTALHSVRLPEECVYLCGPLARMNQCLDQLPSVARRVVDECRIAWPSFNNFHSIVARAIEMVVAFEEALTIVRAYHAVPSIPRVPYELKAGEACHATEAPRGLIYHRYRIGDDGLIAEAKIVPPTSQNQGQIEDDLRAYLPQVIAFDDGEVTKRCEHLIRNFDPCISCATHFLQLSLDRGADAK